MGLSTAEALALLDQEQPTGLSTEQALATLQQPQQQPALMDRARQFGTDAVGVAAELAGRANKSIFDTLDFIPQAAINAPLNIAESMGMPVTDARVPKVADVLESLTLHTMQPGTAREAIGAAGSLIPAAAGMVQVPRNLATAAGALAEFLGAGSAAPAANVARTTEQKLALLRNTGDASTANVMLDQAGNVVKDAAAKAAQKQGFEPRLVAFVKSMNPDTRKQALTMLDIVDKGKQNFRYSADNRPLNVIGNSIDNRIKVVREANRVAAVRLDGVADTLKGAAVDVSPAVDSFVAKLTDMGMQYNPQTGNLILIKGSATQDMPKVHKQAAKILQRLQTTRTPGEIDGYDVHTMKKWIDNFVDMSKKGKGGMIGKLEGAIKGLRHDLDTALDTQFPQYNKVNTQYAETRGKLDEIQDIAGKKFDFDSDSAALSIGNLSRRFLSNAQSNGRLRDAVAGLDEVARKYIQPGTDLVPYKPIQRRSGVTPAMLENDDLVGLALYADELDKMFGAASRTSLQGDVQKAVNMGVDAALGQKTMAGMLAEGAKVAANKARGINEQNAIKSMRELLIRGQ